jgi:large subunit ribosomal protein L25
VLNIVRHQIELVCVATQIPHQIRVDLTGLDIGDSVHISAVKLPEGVRTTIIGRDFTVATVAAPTTTAVEIETAAAAAAPVAMAPVEVITAKETKDKEKEKEAIPEKPGKAEKPERAERPARAEKRSKE